MTVKWFFVLVTVSIPVYGILNPASSPLSTAGDSNISDDDKNKFGEWKKNFQRTFKSAAEEQKAMKNLVGNLREIDVHNILYKAGRETYSRALWEMSDLSFEEKSTMLAGSTFNFTSLQLQGPAKKFKAAPSQVNWVKDGRVNSIQNQGRCGSCFAYAAVGAAEGVLLKKGIKTRLSVQQIVDCDKVNSGCDGLFLISRSQAINQKSLRFQVAILCWLLGSSRAMVSLLLTAILTLDEKVSA